MKKAILCFLLMVCLADAMAQGLQRGIYPSHKAYENNKPGATGDFVLKAVVRVNTIDTRYNDTLYRLEGEEKTPFAVYDGKNLFVHTEDTLLRKMDHIGRYAFVTVTTKSRKEAGFVIINRSPIWKEERDEIYSYVLFINKQGKLTSADFESMWAFLKGNKDLAEQFGKEKHVNDTYRKYLLLMNERYPL